MAIELERDLISYSLRTALARHIAKWQREGKSLPDQLARVITESLFVTAGFAIRESPEDGILTGVNMVRNWVDDETDSRRSS